MGIFIREQCFVMDPISGYIAMLATKTAAYAVTDLLNIALYMHT